MKREDLTNWMRGGVILISVLLMGITSCDIPTDFPPPPGGGSSLTEEEMKGQIFILSLNVLAGRNDSHSGVSGFKEGGTDKLDPTIEDNIKKWQPGGIYISAANLETLATKAGASAPGSLKDPLKKLIGLLKDPNIIAIEPLIVTQEGGQFQDLLTREMVYIGKSKGHDPMTDQTYWKGKLSELGKQLGLEGIPDDFVPDSVKDKKGVMTKVVKAAPDNTPYTWGLLEKVVNGGGNDVKKWLDQIYGLGFSLNYWLVGGTVRGPYDDPATSNHAWARVQGSANVMGYLSAISGSETFFSKILSEWKSNNTVTLIGDFPGRSFTEAAKGSQVKLGGRNPDLAAEMEWGKLGWKYLRNEAVAAVNGEDIDKDVRTENKNRGRDKLYYFAQAIAEGVDIVGLTQDALYKKLKGGEKPWKSRDLIGVLRNEMKFGNKAVVMVGDRTALVRDQHPYWTSGGSHTAVGKEMSSVVQLSSTMVVESLYAGADLFHLWRFDHGPSASGLRTVGEVLAEEKNAVDPLTDPLVTALRRSRWRIIEMKRKNNFRIPSPEPLPPPDFEDFEPYELEP